MAYLPTVEFGPGMTSATEIRNAWPTLNEKRKTALVMSLYPKTQTNPKLAANVVKMLDVAIGTEVDEGLRDILHFMPIAPKATTPVKKSVIDYSALRQAAANGTQEKVYHSPEEYARATGKDIKAEDLLPVDETKKETHLDPDLLRTRNFARSHYSGYNNDPDAAFEKWVQRSLMHSEEDDEKNVTAIKQLQAKVAELDAKIKRLRPPGDYVEENRTRLKK